jgi:signal transduction histidine kinase
MTARALARAAAAVALLGTLASLPACDAASAGTAEQRRRLLEKAAEDVRASLEDALARGRRAVAQAPAVVEAAGSDRGARFAALEALARRARVDGLTWNDPGGGTDWAGVPLQPKPPPPPPPWDGSFSSGDVTYHSGPFLRALVVAGDRARAAGFAEATVVLRDAEPGFTETSIESRWASRHTVKAVRVLPGDSHGASPGGETLRVAVGSPGHGKPGVLTVEVESPSEQALAEMAAAKRRGAVGGGLVAATALAALAAAWLARRLLRSPRARWASLGAVALLARQALRAIDLADRFPGLAPAFRAEDFAITGWLGWFSSPGEFFLTGVALLAAAVGFTRAFFGAGGAGEAGRSARVVGRALLVAAGLAIAVAASVGWLRLVATAAHETQIHYFRPGGLLPSLARLLMLSGLAAATAAAYVLASGGARLAVRGARGPETLVRLGVAVAAAGGTIALTADSLPAWAGLLVPFAGALLGRVGRIEGAEPGARGAGAPSRILLTSVLAVALLVPVLWERADASESEEAVSTVKWLVTSEQMDAEDVEGRLLDLREDPYLVETLSAPPDARGHVTAVALYAWERLNAKRPTYDRAVTVVDAKGSPVDEFSLVALPPARLGPFPNDFPAQPDVLARTGYESFRKVRSTAARLTVRAPDGRVVGHVLVRAPDPLAMEMEGFRPRITATPEGPAADEPEALTLLLVRDGRVVASNDPTVARSEPSLPKGLEALAGPRWLDDAGPDGQRGWLAYPAPDRGVVLASRPRLSVQDAVLAIARVSIVGVGIGAVLALGALLAGLRGFRPRLQHKILWSYFAVSVVPLVVLGVASWRDAKARHEARFVEGHRNALRAAREVLGSYGEDLFGVADDKTLSQKAAEIGQDMSLYRNGDLHASSLTGLIDAELLPRRLPAEAYRAIEIEGREFLSRDEEFAGRQVRVGYAPVRDTKGAPFATVSVPLLYDTARAEREASETGSVLLAAYLLTLVLVVVIGIYTSRGLSQPLEQLSEGTKRVAAGEEDVAVPPSGGGEIGGLVDAFNRMTRELKDIRARAAKAEREAAWRGMARQVAHEIKNPLTPMKLMLQQLVASAQKDPASIGPLIEPTARVVLEQIETLKRIADDFSAFARFPPRHLKDADVNEILTSVATLYGGASARGLEMSLSLDEGLPRVHWDADELRRVFVNLVANAVESLDPSSSAGPGRVTIHSQRARGTSGREGVLVSIADTGVGIPPEDRKRLFEPDFSTKSSGTGLGLAIVKRILEDLGGSIRIDPEVGRGTTVTVWLPAASPAPPA